MSAKIVSALSDKELRDKLIAHGVSVGPVTESSRRVLEKKLVRLMDGTPSSSSPSRAKKPQAPVVDDSQFSTSTSSSARGSRQRKASNSPSRVSRNSASDTISSARLSDGISSSRGSDAFSSRISDGISSSRGSDAYASRLSDGFSSRITDGYSSRVSEPFSSSRGSRGLNTPEKPTSLLYPAVNDDRPSNVADYLTYADNYSPPRSPKKKITTTPPLQRYNARPQEFVADTHKNISFQNDFDDDDHMEWSRELSDNERSRYDPNYRSDYQARVSKFDTSFLRKDRANAQLKQVKSWYAQNEVLVNSLVFSSIFLLTGYALIRQYPDQIKGGVSSVTDAASSLVFVSVHYAIIPAATLAIFLAVLVGGFYGYRYKVQSDRENEQKKRELIETIIRKVQFSSPKPVPINQLRDDMFPVYTRTKAQEKLWNDCEAILQKKDSRIRCDLHRTDDGDTVSVFRWIGGKF